MIYCIHMAVGDHQLFIML